MDTVKGSERSRNSRGYANAPESGSDNRPRPANAPTAMQQMAPDSDSASTPAPPSQVVSESADEKMEEAKVAPQSKSQADGDDNKKDKAEIAVGGSSTDKGDYELAIQHYKNKRYDKAIAEFKEFLNNNQGSKKAPAAEHNIARSYQRSNRLRRAMYEYQRLLKRFPIYRYRNAVLIETARLELALGQLDAARKHLKEAASDKSIAKEVKQLLSRVEREIKIRRRTQKKAKAKSAETSKKAAKSSKKATPKAPAKTKSAPSSTK
ncbi:MAG TPA: hypothetical protein EYN06_06340 [Myxococcales bacterium]|nr:hypothetical protein [Myxococcales bacterium]